MGDVRAVGKPPESEATILGTSGRWGEKYSIPYFPFPVPVFPTLTRHSLNQN